MPVPSTAMVEEAPARAPRCAAASMPIARPDTMVRPALLSALAKHAAQCGGTQPGSERQLQPARQPGVARHAGGGEAGKPAPLLLLLWRLDDIQCSDRPRDVHHQRVRDPVEDPKHKRKSGAFI